MARRREADTVERVEAYEAYGPVDRGVNSEGLVRTIRR